jgi:uncharacterized protein YciI
MPLYLVRYHYTDDAEAQALVRPTHRQYLAGLGDVLVGSGPTDDNGAALVFAVDSVDAVSAIVADDPFSTGGFIAAWTAVEWTLVLGRWAQAS